MEMRASVLKKLQRPRSVFLDFSFSKFLEENHRNILPVTFDLRENYSNDQTEAAYSDNIHYSNRRNISQKFSELRRFI